jgi:hypothetical protein
VENMVNSLNNASRWQMGFNLVFKGLMKVIVKNQETFQTNSSIHNINTRNKHHKKL